VRKQDWPGKKSKTRPREPDPLSFRKKRDQKMKDRFIKSWEGNVDCDVQKVSPIVAKTANFHRGFDEVPITGKINCN